MDTLIQVETHLKDIRFLSCGFDSVRFIQDLRNSFTRCEFLTIENASDRVQFETSTMFANSSEQLNRDDIVRQVEDQLVVDMVNASPISTKWLVVRLDDENRLSSQKNIRDLIKNYKGHLTFKLPEFVPSTRWFAIGIPVNEPKELSLGMINHGSQILVYWLNSFANDDQQQNKLTIKLTPREQEVLHWASEGKTSQDISVILGISHKTVNLHADNFISKLNASNRTNAVARAIRLNLI
jgi:DNA-binding CsgD family transcriptional regulator